MGYFHVLLTIEGEDEKFAYRDLSEAELKSLFVKPYGRGDTLLVDNQVVALDKIRGMRILVSSEHSKVLLEREQKKRADADSEWNSQSRGVVFFNLHPMGPDDLAKLSADVTTRYITRLTGSKSSPFSRALNHPWMLGIAAALVATVLAAYITRMLGLT